MSDTDDLRERIEAAIEDWFNHLTDDDEPTIEQIGQGVAAAVLAVRDEELERLRAELTTERQTADIAAGALAELARLRDDPDAYWAAVYARLRGRAEDAEVERDALKAAEQRAREFADYIGGWSAEHDSEVTEHEIETMQTAAKVLRRAMDGES